MPIEIYAHNDEVNLFAKSELLKKLSRFEEIPLLKLSFITNDIVKSLSNGDFSIHGLWFDRRNPEELIFPTTQRTLMGDSYCWLYHLYTDDYMRLKRNEIFYNYKELPCFIPLIISH